MDGRDDEDLLKIEKIESKKAMNRLELDDIKKDQDGDYLKSQIEGH